MVRFSNHTFSRQFNTWLTVTLLALLLTLPAIPAQAASVLSPLAPTPPMTGQAALDHLKARQDYPALVEAITAARYAIHPVADGSGLWAQNPAHDLNVTFTPQGVAVTAPGPALNPTEPDATYRTRWQLTSLGYGAAQQAVAAGALHAAGTRVELVRPSVTEWFVNGPSGLEHGFTLPTRPAANPQAAPLRLTMQVDGALTPQADGDGQQLTLHNAAGQVVLTYDQLKVWDATGAPLPARLLTRGRQVQVLVDDAQARYPLTIDPTFSQQAYLKANNSGTEDRFGTSVAVSGDTVVVGAPWEDSNATSINGDGSNNSALYAGAAYVFVRSGSSWSQQAYLKAHNSGAYDAFGQSVAVSGDTVVIGATGEASNATTVNGDGSDNSASGAGAAYVFVRSGSSWSQQAYLKAHNSEAGDWFGYGVAVSGDTVVVGAYREASNATTINGDGSDNSASYAGAVYVFVRSGNSWSQQAYLKANNSEAGDIFGWSVAVSGDTVVVGAYQEASNATTVNGDGSDNSAPYAGAAYVFVRSGSSWSQQAYLKAHNSQAADYFGYSVAVSGDTVVVGASWEASNATTINGDGSDNSASYAGAAYVFVRSSPVVGGTWSQQAYLKASNSAAGDEFGYSVAVSSDTVVVGAPYEDSNATTVDGAGSNNSASGAGAAYVFVRSGPVVGGTWSQQAYLKANNSGAIDIFGWSVAVSGDTVVAGANREDSNATTINGNGSDNSATDAGAVYVFALPSLVPEIDVMGNSVSIVSGDTTPSSSDHTDFGSVDVSSGTMVRTFTIQNTGAGALSLSTPTLSGANAGDFSISSAPAGSVAANGSTTFQVTFDPSAAGVRTAIASIANNDSDENPYTFALQGRGTAPEIDVLGNDVSIANGDSTPSTSDATDFGTAEANGNFATSSLFFIANVGDGQLDISDITLSGTGKDEFRIIFFSDPPASVPPNNALEDSFVFYVDFGPRTPGLHAATVSIANNDSNENPYTFAIQGTGTSAAPSLSIPSTSRDASNGSFSVPVNFTSDGANIASVGFGLDYQESCLTFDATDGNSDDIPDAISGLPSGFVASISHDANDTGSELDISLFDTTAPMLSLSDGALLTVAFTVKPGCITTNGTTTNVTINFAGDPAPSFSNAQAADVTGTSSGATIALQFNATPTAISLSNNSVAENAASGATVGTLSTVDPDSGDTHTYALVSGSGDTDNASFVLDGATLKTAASFDFETKSSYSVRIRTTDNGGLNGTFEQALTINVTNVNEAPVAVADAIDPLTTIFVGGQATTINVLANDSDVDGNTLTVAAVDTTGTQGSVINNGANVSYTAPNANGSSSFTYQAGDSALNSASATVNVSYVKNDLRGDCNANGSVTAADFVGTILEIFDTNDTLYNGNPAWWLIHTGDFAGSPRGCDSNAGKNGLNNTSDSVSAGDLICTVLLFFKGNCGSTVVAAGAQNTAQLAVADASAQPGQTATVTVNFDPAGNQVAAASFALVFDSSKVGFDATDADSDGVPDAVQLTVPAGMSKSVQWNAAQSRLEVALFGASLPLPTLSAGVLATVNVQVAATATPGVTELGVTLASLGDTAGQDLAVAPTSGVLTIGDGAAVRNLLYLPVAVR